MAAWHVQDLVVDPQPGFTPGTVVRPNVTPHPAVRPPSIADDDEDDDDEEADDDAADEVEEEEDEEEEAEEDDEEDGDTGPDL